MGLEALHLVEGAEVRVAVVEADGEADGDLVVLQVVEEGTAIGRAVQGPADGVDDAARKGWCGFLYDADGLFLESRCAKSMLKSAMSQLGIFQDGMSRKPVGSKTTHDTGLFIEPYRLRFYRDGGTIEAPDGAETLATVVYPTPLATPDGTEDMAVHVNTAQGRRSSLVRADYVIEPSMRFVVKVVMGSAIHEKDLIRALALCQDVGLGAKRSQGFGQFEITGLHYLGVLDRRCNALDEYDRVLCEEYAAKGAA